MKNLIFVRPLIGALIGYATNWIAVKMLFRPIKPLKIGKRELLFTQGIIPRSKDQLADAIGCAVSENLLTEESLKESFLSENVKTMIKQESKKYFEENENKIIDIVALSIKDVNLGKIIANQIEEVAKEKMKGSLIGIFGGEKISNLISKEAEEKVNEYIELNGNLMVKEMLENGIQKYCKDKTLEEKVVEIYENIVLEKFTNIFKEINISKIVSDKIKEMDIMELEKLILNIMKKQLNALVNLGAIIGFVLGLLNLAF